MSQKTVELAHILIPSRASNRTYYTDAVTNTPYFPYYILEEWDWDSPSPIFDGESRYFALHSGIRAESGIGVHLVCVIIHHHADPCHATLHTFLPASPCPRALAPWDRTLKWMGFGRTRKRDNFILHLPSIYKISGSGSHRVALMVFESHFCSSESGTRFPECDWLPGGFDGNKISARCADVSAMDANYIDKSQSETVGFDL
ncbi:hypothetical protein DFH08DRAFT_812586 [Mycena albidolilacea]|uniref:Uncharacterized protein n=1 Tax=Mycena albidolilacea TaxID=1033008 RepID=A0AAD6ZU18_9AGAR|nr:hypothetical protein DFH08DRAFT_812586 [Mycena albidolilacea]